MDTRTDRFVAGTPVRVLIRGDDGLDADKGARGCRRQGKAAAGAARHRPRRHADRRQALDGARRDRHLPDGAAAARPRARRALPDGRSLSLTLSERALGSAMCAGYGGTGTAGRAKIVGLQLSMQLGGATTLLQEDAALPRSRRCAHAYGIAEAWLHRAPDGGLTLAVLVEYADNDGYHAGPNRRFLAVTRKLPKP
ncbi:MAG: DUF2259 domain-containing protein [Pseudorhodoplanes sp.]|nr:DUF2259 domain-containing protein [Pseudorhodoplanes sp.]